MSGGTVLSWNERGSIQPHREDIIGVWMDIDGQNILPCSFSQRWRPVLSTVDTMCWMSE